MQVYTVKEVADLLKVNARTIERLIEQEHIQAMRVGRRLRITGDALQAYVAHAEDHEESMTRTSPAPLR
jgi:excisionase family DNA binding protein